ncbi:ABC transporter permease [Porphyromonas sp.]|uniref:ABC transporter permease n=1 Tax=Porphyromonas sp. TaxID=1924944 RepID=UPI0026DB4F69|nr:ABC transporter permease [Porphyromonas sp.]MDO4771214.1 ABC transporter permease [Porphyromonas sp.]
MNTEKTSTRRKMREVIEDIFYIFSQENRMTYRDTGVMIFFVLVPLLYPLLYSYIYNPEVVRKVPIAVVNDSGSSLSRDYLRRVNATPDVEVIAYCANMSEAQEMMRSHKAHGIVYIPEDFDTNLNLGRQSTVSLYCDMSGLLYYKSIVIANTNASLEMNKEIKIARGGKTTDREEEILSYPVEYEEVALFNPTSGFASFLLPAVLILIIQQTLLLGVGLSAGTIRERNRSGSIIPSNIHYSGPLRIVIGKGMSYFIIYSLIGCYTLCIVPWLFDFVHIGNPMAFFAFLMPYLSACVFFAMTCSVLIRNRETGMMIFVFTSVPLLFLSGISWPGTSIAPFWKYLSYLFPSTFGINGFVKINNMGAELSSISTEYIALWTQAVIYFATTYMVYRWQKRKALKHASQTAQSEKG